MQSVQFRRFGSRLLVHRLGLRAFVGVLRFRSSLKAQFLKLWHGNRAKAKSIRLSKLAEWRKSREAERMYRKPPRAQRLRGEGPGLGCGEVSRPPAQSGERKKSPGLGCGKAAPRFSQARERKAPALGAARPPPGTGGRNSGGNE